MRAEAPPEVLHVRSSSGLYGAEYVLLGLIPALRDIGIGGRLLCLNNPYLQSQSLQARAQALGVPAETLPCRGRFDLATVRALRRTLRAAPDAIVHVHDYKSALYTFLARSSSAHRIVATSHGHFATSLKLRTYQRLEIQLMRRFDEVCIVSESMRPLLRRAGIADTRIQLIENGIDTRRFSPDARPWPRDEIPLPADAFVFGAAMRLTEQKNPLGLVDAFTRVVEALPNSHLLIAGAGELRAPVLAQIEKHGLSAHVHLLGARDDLERFYSLLDVFVLPSWYEGLPLALLEAMACAKPVVATAVGQVPAVLRDLPVEMVAPGDTAALAQAMLTAVGNRDGALLRERVLSQYSVKSMAAAYAGVYRTIGGRHGRAAA
ncbi:MAG: glycosyltransferase [Rudaea sp.]|uniref:glycosyltransferase n=1 Tax=Rudaea sp. TaxID=2136325 RepID=UPI0039E5531C